MRVIQKSLVDYNAIDTLIQVQRFIGSKQNATLLFDAKQSLARCYGRQAANYSLLVSSCEDNSYHKIEFVPQTTSCNASPQAAITYKILKEGGKTV